MSGTHAGELNDALGRIGFRRSQNVAYRPSCLDCAACISVRVVAQEFQPNASQRRVIRRNADLEVTACKPWATEEQYELLRRYLRARHPDGGMVEMDEHDFSDMVEQSPVKTYIVEYREPTADGRPGRLVGACLTDQQADGLSMIYSFFEPDEEGRSGLGTYIILDHIVRAGTGRPALRLSRLLGRGIEAHGLQGALPPARAARPGRLAALRSRTARAAAGLTQATAAARHPLSR